ncbi:MAG: extracellular solute-binding protein [Planctomycetota bacterium]
MSESDEMSLTRRAALGTVAAAAAGFALFGPRPLRDPRDGRTLVTYWEKWTGYEADAMRATVRAFNESQDRIRVRFLTVDRLDQKAKIAIAAHDPPDVLGVWTHNLAEYSESGSAEPLDDLIDTYGLGDSAYLPAFRDFVNYRGRRMAALASVSSCLLYYNRQAFAEAGLDPDRPPRTFDELAEFARKLTVESPDGELERIGMHPLEPPWWPWSWAHYGGESVWSGPADRSGGRPRIADDAVVGVYDRLYRLLIEPHGADRLNRFLQGNGPYNSTDNGFLSGRVAMVMQGAFLANVIDRHAPNLDYGAAAMPVDEYTPDRPRGAIEADLLMIPKGCRSPEAAMEFVAFTQRRGPMESLALAHRKFSPLTEVSTAFAEEHPNPFIDDHRAVASGPGAFHIPLSPIWTEYRAELNVAVNRVMSGRSTARDAFALAQSRTELRVEHLERKRRVRASRGGIG